MDTALAEPIAAALRQAVARGDTGYAHPGRLPEAFAGFAGRRYGWAPDPARIVRGARRAARHQRGARGWSPSPATGWW